MLALPLAGPLAARTERVRLTAIGSPAIRRRRRRTIARKLLIPTDHAALGALGFSLRCSFGRDSAPLE
jgi:hypothetical protein